MKKLVGLFILFLVCIAPAMAQDTTQGTATDKAPEQDQTKSVKAPLYTPKYEISVAFTHRSFYAPTGLTLGMNGWDASFDYNLRPWLGVEGEILGTSNDQGVNGKTTIYTALVGPQIYPLKHHKITPFAHALLGVGHYNLTFPAESPFPSSSITHTADAWDFGGGVDFYVWKNLGVRVVQLDYDKASFFSGQGSRVGYRVSFGVVYRMGER